MDKYYDDLRVRVHAEEMGTGLCITICGGDEPHIGSVAVAEPRESLSGEGRSATVSTFNFTGHKDDEVANVIALAVASRLDRRTVVICGLHYSEAGEDLFRAVRVLTDKIADDLCAQV